MSKPTETSDNVPITAAHLLGEMVALSALADGLGNLSTRQLVGILEPAIMSKQLHIFRDQAGSVGFAIWAMLDDAKSRLVSDLGVVEADLMPADWQAGGNCWLIALVAPRATPENHQRELMFADLVAGPLRGRAFRMRADFGISPARPVVDVPADTGEKIVAGIQSYSAVIQ